MIRSRWANGFILGLGMLLVALALAVGYHAVRESLRGAFIGINNILPAVLALGLGIWCVRGAAVNFSSSVSEPTGPASWPLIALRCFVFVLCTALVGAIAGSVLMGRGYGGFVLERLVLISAATLAVGALIGLLIGIAAVVRR